MKPAYASLKGNHYSANKFSSSYLSGEALYEELGHDQQVLIKQNSGYVNTCATRMSLALIKSGVAIRGRLKIKDGEYKGKTFEPGAKLLADQLAKPHALGRPQIFKATEAAAQLAGKKGIVFFLENRWLWRRPYRSHRSDKQHADLPFGMLLLSEGSVVLAAGVIRVAR